MRLIIPPTSDVVPGTAYEGFVPLSPIDSRGDSVTRLKSEDVLLVWPEKALLNTERRLLTKKGIILGIGFAFALQDHPSAILPAFKGQQHGESVKIITSTRMRSEYDDRNYLAYFYIDDKGAVVTSFVAEKPWGSACPSPAIAA